MKTAIHKTREQWLGAAIDALRPMFKARAQVTLPTHWRVSCGWTSKGSRGKRIGECWSSASSKDGAHEMFISPVLDDATRVLGVLVHELVHAGVGVKHGHDKTFGKAARAMLLEGKLTATTEGEPFKKEIAGAILSKLGDYPHAELRSGGLSTSPKKQKTRLLKVFCPGCSYCARITSKWIEVAVIECPNEECDRHGEEMEVES